MSSPFCWVKKTKEQQVEQVLWFSSFLVMWDCHLPNALCIFFFFWMFGQWLNDLKQIIIILKFCSKIFNATPLYWPREHSLFLRTMASDTEMLILIPAALHSAANCPSAYRRSWLNYANMTTLSAKMQSCGHQTRHFLAPVCALNFCQCK